MRSVSPRGRLLDSVGAGELVPVLRREYVLGAVFEPVPPTSTCTASITASCAASGAHGGDVVDDAEVVAIRRDDGGRADVDTTHWPLFGSVDERGYVKPDAGLLLGSPANADPVAAQDVQPEELDIAIAIDRIAAATTRAVRPRCTSAGLRSFVADGDLVGGFAPTRRFCPGHGARRLGHLDLRAARGEACAALARGQPVPARTAAFGLDAAALAPGRPSLTKTRSSAC